MLCTAPRRPYIPIIVYAGESIKDYLVWGLAAVAAMVLLCPACGRRLTGNGWHERVVKERSGREPKARRISVHQLVCPCCHAEGRHPWNFTVLPSFLFPFRHFSQHVRLAVFNRAWREHESALAIEAACGVDRWLVRLWLARALDVLAAALPALGAALQACGGQWPAVEEQASLWVRWCDLSLALREALCRLDPELERTGGSVLEWMAVLGARRQRWWAP